MKLLYYLTDLFVDTFGITRPTPEIRRRSAFFIMGLLLVLLAGVAAAGVVLHSLMK